MDNFFEILIYLFIIFTFLSSVFKKKKPEQQKPKANIPQERQESEITYSPEEEMDSAPVKSSSDEYDILKELEQFFKVGEPTHQQAPKPKPPVIPQPAEVKPKQKALEESWRVKTESEHKYEDFWGKRQRDVDARKKEVDSMASLQASKFEELLKEKKVYSTAFQRNIKKRIKEPASLKEYIIISEILGKPKALRRR